MADGNGIRMPQFTPKSLDMCAPEWRDYKRSFAINLDAAGLHDSPGRRKVGNLLRAMGPEAVKIYDTFEWLPAVAATETTPGRAAEDKYSLDDVLSKFDNYFGVRKYRSLKRQEFLDTKRKTEEGIMDFVTRLRSKADHCEYGEAKDSFIVDKIINCVGEERCVERLLEIPDEELTLDRVIHVCRQHEIQTAHKSYLAATPATEDQAQELHKSVQRLTIKPHTYCRYCCRNHGKGQCPAYNARCDVCGQVGHYARSHGKRQSHFGQRQQPQFGQRQQRHSHWQTETVQQSHSRGKHFGQHRQRHWKPKGAQQQQRQSREKTSDFNVRYAQANQADCDSVNDVFYFNTALHNDDVVSHVKPAHASHSPVDIDLASDDFTVCFHVKGKALKFHIDTAAQCNVISLDTVNELGLAHAILPSHTLINGIHNTVKQAFGEIHLPCMYRQRQHKLCFQILDSSNTVNLLGCLDATKLKLIARINTVNSEDHNLLKLIDDFKDVIGDDIGCLPEEQEITIDESVSPVINPPRPLPAAIRDQTKRGLDILERKNIIAKIDKPTRWVSNMVAVRKKNGRVRICLDPTHLNKAIMRPHHPMNTLDDIATRLYGSKHFSTLDANSGYFQIKLTPESSLVTTFTTPFGRYRYLRMPMGTRCSAEIFQREMVKHFSNLEGVEIVVDDILVHGRTQEEHHERLKKVLEKARSIGLKLNKDKSHFGLNEVNYVGHKLTGEGLRPSEERIKAITNMKEPRNVEELNTILGMIAYVGKFIPNLSHLTGPLRDLRKEWKWTETEAQCLKEVKKILTSKPLLQYYDVNKPVLISVDASMRGLGAALLQGNGVVAYASRALTPAEERYAQIEKEALAVVFGLLKFHKLIYGKQDVTVESDHKPLEAIMKKPIHRAPPRIQRMLLKVQPYTFKLIYKKGTSIGLADCLSRLPEEANSKAQCLDDELMICWTDTLVADKHEEYVQATLQDTTAIALIKTIKEGWPNSKWQLPDHIKRFWNHRDELSTHNGIIMCCERIYIPENKRGAVIKNLHKSHMGMIKTKQLARQYVFWPSMNAEIEETISKCNTCLELRNQPPREPMIPHPVPSRPWSKVGSDIFELQGRHYLILVDYYSNYIEVEALPALTSRSVIQQMKRILARHGIMDLLISDNGPQYSSAEFKEFTRQYGIQHLTSSPLRPQSNGLAEKAVQTIKRMMIKCIQTNTDFYLALMDLRNCPREDIGSPSQRLMGRTIQSLIPTTESALRPRTIPPEVVIRGLERMKEKEKNYYDRSKKSLPSCSPDQAIRMKAANRWIPAEYVREDDTPRSHIVRAGPHGHEYRRNRDQLLVTNESPHVIISEDRPHTPETAHLMK